MTRRSGWRIVRWALLLVVAALLAPYALAPLYTVVDPVSTPMMWRRLVGARVERAWIPLESVAPALRFSVLAAEDARFCLHRGVDWGELRDVIREADDFGDLRGGSTITQQTVKNLFLWQGRSVVRKALEFPLALWFDLVVPKRRIFEIYLNIAEWGPDGQFGVSAGARRAFAKSPADLTAQEAALLAAVLPNPARRDARRPLPGLRRLAKRHQVRGAALAKRAECVGPRRAPRPQNSPHSAAAPAGVSRPDPL